MKQKKKLISIRISEIIPDETLSTFKNEKDILNFFSEKEKEIIKWIFYNLGKNVILNEFAQTDLEEIFKNNNYISEITKNIYTKLENIPLDIIESEDDYNIKLNSIFGDILLPKFLKSKYLKELQNNFIINFTKNRDSIIFNRMSYINRNFTIETKTIIEHFENIKSSKVNVFENINNKDELFNLFVLVNYKIFQKPYFDLTFFSFLKYNEKIIKQYFGENTNCNELFEKLDYKEINNKKEELFNIIKKSINMNTDKLYIIIASFFYLLFYKFKDIKEIKDQTNIGNVYINVILKKYVKFFGQRLDNLHKNLIDLLNELYFYDLNNSVDKNNKKINNSYSFDDINNLMSKSSYSNLFKVFDLDKKEYEEIIKENIGIFTDLEKKCYENNSEKFCLTPIDKNIYSNTITIIIDMFSTKDKGNEWIKFIEYFDKETMFYFMKWSYFPKKYLLEKGKTANVSNVKNLSKICGKILADILMSFKIFNNFQINLVGFSLGANVVKYCLKQLSMLNEHSKNKYVKIKNVILIGAGTHIKHEDKWKELIKTTVIDRFINCYSSNDEKLKDFYFICSKCVNKLHKLPIGLNSLELKDDKGNNLVRNFDFTEDNYEQLSYEFEKVAEKIFPKFKDI